MSYDERSVLMSSFIEEIPIKERRSKKQTPPPPPPPKVPSAKVSSTKVSLAQPQQKQTPQVLSVQHSPPPPPPPKVSSTKVPSTQTQSLLLLAQTLLLQLPQLPPNLRSIFREDTLQKIVKEEEDNKPPKYYYLIHPDYRKQPLSLRTTEELDKWNEESNEQCDKLSLLFREERKKRYYEKNNWHPCPSSKTHFTKEENEKGWIYHNGCVNYRIPININKYTCMSNYDYEFLYFIKKVLFNRSNEVCQCTIWKELKNIFEDCWELKHGDRYTPDLKKALWLISPCANVFPGKQLPRITNPTNPIRKYVSSLYKIVTINMGDYHLQRENTGICTATNFHELGDMAPIHWHVTPEELQKTMTYFDFIEGTPIDYFDDPYSYYEDEDDILGW
jgi:hypothetical protein